MSLVRMRYPAEAYEQLKQDDPNTRVTLNFIRSIVRRGLVPSIKNGRGRLLNYDALLEYLANPQEKDTVHAGGIRRIPE